MKNKYISLNSELTLWQHWDDYDDNLERYFVDWNVRNYRDLEYQFLVHLRNSLNNELKFYLTNGTEAHINSLDDHRKHVTKEGQEKFLVGIVGKSLDDLKVKEKLVKEWPEENFLAQLPQNAVLVIAPGSLDGDGRYIMFERSLKAMVLEELNKISSDNDIKLVKEFD